MAKSSRTQQVKFLVSENELKMIDARVCSLNFGSRASYLRKMAVNGVVINIDMSEIQKLTSAIGAIGNNVNQAVHKINTYGLNLNDTEVIKSYMERIWLLLKSTVSNLQSAKQSTTLETLKKQLQAL